MSRISLIFAAGLLSSGLIASTASAQALQDRYWIEAAAYWPSIETTVNVSTPNGRIGTDIDLENDLNMKDSKTLPAFLAGARLGERFTIIGEYYGLDRSGSAAIARDITFDDVTYPAGARVESSFESDVYRLVVGYSFIRRDDLELGAAIGLHATSFDAMLSGEGRIGDAQSQRLRRERDLLAPMPTVGLYGGYQATPRLTLTARTDYMSLGSGKYDGRILNAEARASYRVWKNVGVGAMYRYVDYDFDIEKDRWNGRLDYTFSGPALFLQAAF